MSTAKKALVTGITGQDGAYLAELLLAKGYEVHGVRRRLSRPNTQRIDHLIGDTYGRGKGLILHHGDMADSTRLTHIIRSVQPDEVYNLAAQSHVQVSFETPEYTTDVDALGTLRLLEAIRLLGMGDHVRFYQASTSELFGQVTEIPQNENTPFHPRSPYGVSKLYAYWITVNYREAYGMYACNGVLFNHESPRRGEMFVTRKVTRAVARIALGVDDRLYLGNLEARRDWGHAKDYVDAIWRILQQDEPEDFVVATGKIHTVRQMCEMAFGHTGVDLRWEGEGVEEKGYDRKTGALIVEVDPHFFRPAEVNFLQGDASKAREKLGWVPRYSVQEMIEEMVEHDLALVGKDQGSAVGQNG